ncbi:MAG: hypothetical protein A2534_03315 [Candidatus Magasanikbacteria bacterium RIFOXYD2_FULL_39_9]|uniref:Uncharacterized protein n=1 Tax=Candidatus Magasanikbacteria bacterium RIFOXYD1_FULL_40_23 TaxID=1798705 RepID=A0A1F6PAA7_9BACT|nr:MAG: hypothetical protein A2534_03315 [Candidatus Magasanikbacteria bacterium RIFOXYD2_FULL_39_9]OGH93117.1 MAG: hypothetical protein A2563_00320 [Candidatus Magasanikbacteria bacterium RIFOXYD1_FULL_40_23]
MGGGKLYEDHSPGSAGRPGHLDDHRQVRPVRLQAHAGCRRRRDAILGIYPNDVTARHIIGQQPTPTHRAILKNPDLIGVFLFFSFAREKACLSEPQRAKAIPTY